MDKEQKSLQIPSELNEYLWFIATSSEAKLTELLKLFADNDRFFFAKNVEGTVGFEEPAGDDVEYISWLKAQMGLFLTGHITLEKLVELKVIQAYEGAYQTEKGSPKKETLSIGADVATAYATDFIDFFTPEGEVEDFHNLKRQFSEGMSEEEKQTLIAQDKEKWMPKFNKPFWVRFRIGNTVSSSDKKLNNSAHVEFYVQFNGFPEEFIDTAYKDPKVTHVGPRINLAKHVHEEHVSKVIMIDSLQNQKKVLNPSDYHMVERAVIGAVLPDHYYEKLFQQQVGPHRLRN